MIPPISLPLQTAPQTDTGGADRSDQTKDETTSQTGSTGSVSGGAQTGETAPSERVTAAASAPTTASTQAQPDPTPPLRAEAATPEAADALAQARAQAEAQQVRAREDALIAAISQRAEAPDITGPEPTEAEETQAANSTQTAAQEGYAVGKLVTEDPEPQGLNRAA